MISKATEVGIRLKSSKSRLSQFMEDHNMYQRPWKPRTGIAWQSRAPRYVGLTVHISRCCESRKKTKFIRKLGGLGVESQNMSAESGTIQGCVDAKAHVKLVSHERRWSFDRKLSIKRVWKAVFQVLKDHNCQHKPPNIESLFIIVYAHEDTAGEDTGGTLHWREK